MGRRYRFCYTISLIKSFTNKILITDSEFLLHLFGSGSDLCCSFYNFCSQPVMSFTVFVNKVESGNIVTVDRW